MISNILFTIPSEFVSGLNSGNLIRIGTLLKESGSGRIVGHIQETGIAQQLLSSFNYTAFPPLAAIDASAKIVTTASSLYSNVQLHQLKHLVEGMQSLQYLNLGVAITGIGVSVIGFAIMNSKLKNIESSLTQLSSKLDSHFQNLLERDLRKHYSHVYTLLEKSELAYKFTNPASEWLNIASQLADESGFFRGEVAHLLAGNSFNIDLFTSLLKSLSICNASRIECLMLANELHAAQDLSVNIGQNYSVLFDDMNPIKLANITTIDNSASHKNKDNTVLRNHQLQMKELVQGVRDITDAALTKPMLIENIIEQGISGHEFISMLKNEKEHPLLLVRPAGS
jgi:hypothetical protein